MGLTRKDALRILGGSAVAAGAGIQLGSQAYAEDATTDIRRDVCIIGGGSSGCYTAVRLRDKGLSVAVVERQDRLGGHTETFHDPITGGTIDFGVIVFHDLPLVRHYFARFGVPLATASNLGGGQPAYIDFRTGQAMTGYAPPAPTALPAYLNLLQQYPYLEAGFNLPDPVPAVLLQPFGDLVTQFGLESIVQLVFGFGQGLGNLLRQPAIYVLKNFGLGVVGNLLAGSFLTTARENNHELYEKITTYLGSDALLSTDVTKVRRTAKDGLLVQVRTPSGTRTIHCGKLVLAVPPRLSDLGWFDLDGTERAVFSRFRNSYYWTAVARVSGLPDDASLQNVAAETPYNLPPLPGPYGISATGVPGLYNVKYGSAVPRGDDQVRADIAADIARLRAAGTYPARLRRLEIFRSHNPFELTVTAGDIAAGFYRRLYGLQGRQHTFYTGAAFHSQDSSLLWRFTEELLPQITG